MLSRTGSANRVLLSLELAQQPKESSKFASDRSIRDPRGNRQRSGSTAHSGSIAEPSQLAAQNPSQEEAVRRRPPKSPLRSFSKSASNSGSSERGSHSSSREQNYASSGSDAEDAHSLADKILVQCISVNERTKFASPYARVRTVSRSMRR